MIVLVDRLQDTGVLIDQLSWDNVALRAQARWPKEEKKAMKAQAIELSSQESERKIETLCRELKDVHWQLDNIIEERR
ncbi:hypothetical protein GW17_00025316 [Ensete ventricosum]|nr:hypothetical protein GW17_00025316 [Ensete ventricosum]